MKEKSGDPWKDIYRLIKDVPQGKQIVCLGKGDIAYELVEKWPKRTVIVDLDFSYDFSQFNSDPDYYRKYRFLTTAQKVMADFHRIEFKQESLGALFVPELFLMEKASGLKLLERSIGWLAKGGMVVVRTPTLSDIRFKNFKEFGEFWPEDFDRGHYEFQEITLPGGLKVSPPIPCSEGCDHEYFSFYDPLEIQKIFSSFKECINLVFDYEFEDRGKSEEFLYVAKKI